MRAAALGLLLIAGCTDSQPALPLVELCEAAIKDSIRSPSSYVRIAAKEAASKAAVDFDAQNGFGAVIRSTAACSFDASSGIQEMLVDGERYEIPDHLRSTEWKPAPPPKMD